MRRDPRNTSRDRISLEQLPNDLFAQAKPLRLAGAVHGAEDVSVRDPGRGSPRIGRHLYPRRHRDRPHAAVLPDEIHDAPPPVALLDVADGQGRNLSSAAATPAALINPPKNSRRLDTVHLPQHFTVERASGPWLSLLFELQRSRTALQPGWNRQWAVQLRAARLDPLASRAVRQQISA